MVKFINLLTNITQPIVLVGYSKIVYSIDAFIKLIEYFVNYPTVLVD